MFSDGGDLIQTSDTALPGALPMLDASISGRIGAIAELKFAAGLTHLWQLRWPLRISFACWMRFCIWLVERRHAFTQDTSCPSALSRYTRVAGAMRDALLAPRF